MKRKSILALALALITIGGAAQAEVDLGSNAERTRIFSSNYQEAVATAFPRYQDQSLQKRFTDIAEKYPQGIDNLKIWEQEQLKSIMSAVVPTTTRAGATPKRQYLINRAKGRVLYYQEKLGIVPMKMAQIATIRPKIEALHANLLQRIGITKEEVLFQHTDVMVGQASSAPSGSTKKMDREILGVQTYAIRAIDGIQIEDGEIRIVSKAPDSIDILDARWAPLTFAPNASSLQLRPRQDVQEAITNRIEALADGRKVRVKMAVVMRRVQDEDYYAPAMKVGIRMDGDGEGVIFYEALADHPLSDEASDKTDTAAGGR